MGNLFQNGRSLFGFSLDQQQEGYSEKTQRSPSRIMGVRLWAWKIAGNHSFDQTIEFTNLASFYLPHELYLGTMVCPSEAFGGYTPCAGRVRSWFWFGKAEATM